MRLREFTIRHGVAWESIRRELDLFLRDVAQVLNGGVKLRDQWRIVRDMTIDSGNAFPLNVEVPSSVAIVGVVLIAAHRQSDGRSFSGGIVEWSVPTTGTVRIHSLSALPAGARYDLTLAMVE